MLSDGIITLRAPEPADLEAMFRWENDARFWEGGDTLAPLSRHLLSRFVENYDGDITRTGQLRLIISLDAENATIGAVDIFDFSPLNGRAGIGIYVDEAYRRRGFARRALAVTAAYCRRRLALHQLWCHIAADNDASRALFAAAGYRVSGCLRSWIRRGDAYADAYVFQLML